MKTKTIILHDGEEKRTFKVTGGTIEDGFAVICDRCKNEYAEFNVQKNSLYCSECVSLEFFK